MEQDRQNEGGSSSMQGQLGHRNDEAELKNADAVKFHARDYRRRQDTLSSQSEQFCTVTAQAMCEIY